MVSLQYELEGTASGEGAPQADGCNSQEAARASGLLRSGACQHRQHLLNGALMHNDGYRLYYHSGRPYLVVQVRGVFALSSAVPCESGVSRAERPSSGIHCNTKAVGGSNSAWLLEHPVRVPLVIPQHRNGGHGVVLPLRPDEGDPAHAPAYCCFS